MASWLAQNLAALNRTHPAVAQRIVTADATAVQMCMALDGSPVPIVRSRPLHDLQDPHSEGRAIAATIAQDQQARTIVYGCGCGYHIEPLVAAGLSPVVYEPDAAVMKAALTARDLRHLLPHISLQAGRRVPDFPRNTALLLHPVIAELYPEPLAHLQRRIQAAVERTNDMAEGIFNSSYRNVTCLKNPCDLVAYHMLLWLVRPTLILEIGTYRGGATYWMADILDQLGGDRTIHSFDVGDELAAEVLDHPRIVYHRGGHATFDPSIVGSRDRVLVIEDSSHTYENTREVIARFAPYVTPNSYLVVEDGWAHEGHPELHGGPRRAIDEFLAADARFEVDTQWSDMFGPRASNTPRGFLRRKHKAP